MISNQNGVPNDHEKYRAPSWWARTLSDSQNASGVIALNEHSSIRQPRIHNPRVHQAHDVANAVVSSFNDVEQANHAMETMNELHPMGY